MKVQVFWNVMLCFGRVVADVYFDPEDEGTIVL
jgi:hypothetical protein